VKAYEAELNAIVERNKAQHAEQERVACAAAREKFVPLEVRLARLLATIPPAVQAEGLSLLALQAQLRPRGRGHSRCHIGELGDACRRNGLVRRRRWRADAGGFRALWYPTR
jgi:hypothetical protein